MHQKIPNDFGVFVAELPLKEDEWDKKADEAEPRAPCCRM